MRLSLIDLALSACLATSAYAVPSLTGSNAFPSSQRPLSPCPTGKRSLLQSFAHSFLDTVWRSGQHKQHSRRISDCDQGQFQPLTTTRSRHGEDILLRFNVSTVEETSQLAQVASYMFLDVWEYTQDWVDIRLAKSSLPHVLKNLPESLQHSHTALLQEKELAQAIYDTYPSAKGTTSAQEASTHPHRSKAFSPSLRSSPESPATTNIFFQDYQPLSVIQPWLRLMSSLFTTHVRLLTVGTSYEGRPISGLRIGVHPTNSDQPPVRRKTILITGGIHAREWISVSTANYIAYSLITLYGKDPSVTRMLEDFDFVFVPTLNPDGYVYTWETDRLWRKNRQTTSVRFCNGLDLDRSFPFQWDSSSPNPCSESYAGSSPLEAVEAKALSDWAKNETEANNVELVGLLDLHSYSQQILYPYSFSCDVKPPSEENLEELAAGLAKAIRVGSGHVFQVKQACEGNVALSSDEVEDTGVTSTDAQARVSSQHERNILPRFESGGGSALDWFYHDIRVKYAYQIKLRDRGSYGFLLPREHIVPSGREILDAVMYFGRYLQTQYESESGDIVAKEATKVEPTTKVGKAAVKFGDWQDVEGPPTDKTAKFYPFLELRR